jgi:hypothetical protein
MTGTATGLATMGRRTTIPRVTQLLLHPVFAVPRAEPSWNLDAAQTFFSRRRNSVSSIATVTGSQSGSRRDSLQEARGGSARRFTRALQSGTVPAEVNTDSAPAYPRVLDELVPSALHIVERHANNPVEADRHRHPDPSPAPIALDGLARSI